MAARRRPTLAAGLAFQGLALLGAAVASLWRPSSLFAAPPPALNRAGRLTPELGTAARSAGARQESAGRHASSNSFVGAGALLGFIAALVSSTQKQVARGAAAAVEKPSDEVPRDSRAKGQQSLPMGPGLQRFFSIRNRQFWDYIVNPRTYFARKWLAKDIGYAAFITIIHAGALAAPFYFTWQAFWCFVVGYIITGMFGITLSYHRQLAHLSFKTPKWLEYTFAYCGALALQSHPINWVSSHRHHHGGTETENDVHSPLDGFWWSHMGWLLDAKGTWMRGNKSNCRDLSQQWFYRFLQKTYVLHAIVLPLVGLYALGGLPCVLWGFFFRVVWVWHVTWAVNSVSHVWGFKDWNTDDNSMNNWIVGFFAFGEGWHNNHHAFETSCRHGLKWWQVDFTWYTVKVLNFLGLAWDLKYPTEAKMRRLSFATA